MTNDPMEKETILEHDLPIQLPASLLALVKSIEHTRPTKPSQMAALLKKAAITKQDLLPFADFEHAATDSYGRQLIYKGSNYELMVMSWSPGDFSAIHDHGYTMWGAVKTFGKAEHATFRWEDEHLFTLARWTLEEGEVIGVGHSLIHQMGNKSEESFMSLHVYGHVEALELITGEARIFDLRKKVIQRVNGGAFLNLPDAAILKKEEGPDADFPTLLRFNLESIKRSTRAKDALADDWYQQAFDKEQASLLRNYLEEIIDPESQKTTNSLQWKILNQELQEAATFQASRQAKAGAQDSFHAYAEVYDQVIGLTSLEDFMEDYIQFFVRHYDFDFAQNHTLSIGCGTGLVERFIMDKYQLAPDRVYGMDLSASMIAEAKKRINADVGDLLELDPEVRKWNLAYSGLNVFQYLPHQKLEQAIEQTASILEEGGYFLGDFITPDHIRWYPNVMYSADRRVISLRTPRLVEEEGSSFQESEIINVDFLSGEMKVHYASKHKRFLPPIYRIRTYFETYFKGGVELYDAVELTRIHPSDDSCASTRYIVIARK